MYFVLPFIAVMIVTIVIYFIINRLGVTIKFLPFSICSITGLFFGLVLPKFLVPQISLTATAVLVLLAMLLLAVIMTCFFGMESYELEEGAADIALESPERPMPALAMAQTGFDFMPQDSVRQMLNCAEQSAQPFTQNTAGAETAFLSADIAQFAACEENVCQEPGVEQAVTDGIFIMPAPERTGETDSAAAGESNASQAENSLAPVMIQTIDTDNPAAEDSGKEKAVGEDSADIAAWETQAADAGLVENDPQTTDIACVDNENNACAEAEDDSVKVAAVAEQTCEVDDAGSVIVDSPSAEDNSGETGQSVLADTELIANDMIAAVLADNAEFFGQDYDEEFSPREEEQSQTYGGDSDLAQDDAQPTTYTNNLPLVPAEEATTISMSASLDDLLDFAFAQKEKKDWANALQALQMAYGMYPESDFALFIAMDIANIHKKTGEYDAAINILQENLAKTTAKDLNREFISNIAYLRIIKNILTTNKLTLLPYDEIPDKVKESIEKEFSEWKALP